jgi:hypothetical protein
VGGAAGGDFTRGDNRPRRSSRSAGDAGDRLKSFHEGRGSGTLTRRFVKVQNEQVKFESLVNGEALVTAEVQMAPEGSGTRLAAEVRLRRRFAAADRRGIGREFPVPPIVFQIS